MPSSLQLVSALFAASVDTAFGACKKVHSVKDLNLVEYARASWYVQEQQFTSYQLEDDLRCVVASYDLDNSGWFELPLFFSGKVLSVYNHHEGGDPTFGEDGPENEICASLVDEDYPGELQVAPCALAPQVGAAYWVVAVGKADDGTYEWAVVSGGQPHDEYFDGCTTARSLWNSGLWIMSRQPVLEAEKLKEAKRQLKEMDYTLRYLNQVKQTNCTYEGAYIKN